jgi:TonB-dependent receptor
MKNLLLVLIGFLTYFQLSAQTIKGSISDSQTGESLFGVTVYVTNQQKGTFTDVDGNFVLANLSTGQSKIEVRYIGYQSKVLEFDIKKDTTLNIKLDTKAQELEGVTVVFTVDKGSTTELIRMQSQSAVVLDGVNSEQFKKTPDTKVSDVFKRVSGASIQENKFVVIRGLSDRYNFGLINGSPLPSSETDRKAFSFDLFPSNVLDNLVIYKSASPDLPGEFSGGVINISTIEPKDKIHNLQIGLGYNTISTFRNFSTYDGGGLDFLGFGATSRQLPDGLTPTRDWQLLDKSEKADMAKLMDFNWSTKSRLALPVGTLQYSIGKEWKLSKKSKFGFVYALSYQNSEMMNNSIRREFEEQASGVITKMELKDSVFTKSILNTHLLNLTWRIDDKNTIRFKNLYSVNSEDKVNIRNGVREMDNDPRQWEKSTNFWYTQNNLLTNQLNGKHEFDKWKFNWNLGFSDVRRDIPNLRRLVYRKYSLLENDTTEQYVAIIQSNGTIPTAAGNMFWSKSNEQIYSANYDFIVPVKFSKFENEIKFGGWHQFRTRDFQSRNFGFSQYKPNGSQFNSELLLLGPDQIFSQENLGLLSDGRGGFKLDEATNVDDSYWASSFLNSGFVMTDTKIGKKFRIIGGLRLESYNQKFNYIEFGSNLEKNIDTTVIDFLPSVNLVYSITNKMKLRGGYSKTVSRPEFRELAPFSFYNFVIDNIISGNTNLQRATIDNVDLRLEFFPGSGQIISLSGFYKQFTNPIELINRTGTSGAPELYYTNVPSVSNFGGEMEIRTNLGFISHNKVLDNLTVYTNASLISSEVNLDHFIGSGGRRPLQGQSPYIVNCGLFYQTPKKDFNVNLSYNVIGPRIFIVGNVQEPSVWENGRNVIDLQLTKTFKDDKIELKLNIKDILTQDLVYFQDLNGNRKYDLGDNRWQEINFGQSISLSFRYKL